MSIQQNTINRKDINFFGAWPKETQSPSVDKCKQNLCNSNSENDFSAETINRNLNQYNYNRAMKSRFQRVSSLELIPEYPHLESIGHNSCVTNTNCRKFRKANMLNKRVRRVVFLVPCLFVRLVLFIIRYILFIPLSIATPSFWLSALLWVFWKLLRFPINLLRWFSNVGNDGEHNVRFYSTSLKRTKRTILISCGSTIQTLHLARNFHSSGARVIVFEFEGLFGLARFSQAVDKFYVVPRPTANNPDTYINALCQVVKKEKPSIYIPVCATSPAYYDALAKPHLELLGCASFIPGVKETILLDDCVKFFQKCNDHDIGLPPHTILHSLQDLQQIYSSGFVSNFRNILMAVGMQGLLERYKYILPNNNRELKFNHEISEQNPWLVVRDLPGDHYITCTTVKDSRVIANVTCKVEYGTQNLIPIDTNGFSENNKDEVENWLQTFFSKVRFQRNINGHISFRLVRCQANKKLLPLGVRLGVSLPYICYNRSHAHVLFRTIKCVHLMHLSVSQDEESILSALGASWKWSSPKESNNAVALDKREALFAFWDPLPYCAFYHFQLPLKSVQVFLENRYRSTKHKSISSASCCDISSLNSTRRKD